jgi:hypothetical protein
MVWNPSKSLHKLAQEKDMGLATAREAVREKLNLPPYKVTSGARTETANNSMKLLNEIFGELVISRNLWLPRSLDLTRPDFYLLGAAKFTVYHDRPRTLNEL